MGWLLLGVGIFLFGRPLLLHWIPPHWRFLSAKKRRAMRLGLRAFDADHPKSRVGWRRSWIVQTDAEKCFVFIEQTTGLVPPNHVGYVVWNGHDQLGRLGVWQFRWGTLARHAIEQFEAASENAAQPAPARRS